MILTAVPLLAMIRLCASLKVPSFICFRDFMVSSHWRYYEGHV